MKVIKRAAVALALCTAVLCAVAQAEDNPVAISSPADGSKVALTGIKLVYDVTPTPKAEHVHIYVDGEQASQQHQLKGSYTIDKLNAGKHTLCVRVVDKGHTPIGQEGCVRVTAGNVPPMGYEGATPDKR